MSFVIDSGQLIYTLCGWFNCIFIQSLFIALAAHATHSSSSPSFMLRSVKSLSKPISMMLELGSSRERRSVRCRLISGSIDSYLQDNEWLMSCCVFSRPRQSASGLIYIKLPATVCFALVVLCCYLGTHTWEAVWSIPGWQLMNKLATRGQETI